jgi:hypothetical protein
MRLRQSVRRERRGFRPLRLEPLEQLVLPGFLAPLHVDAGRFLGSVVTGDFNGDHVSDLAVVADFGVSVLLANGDGTFQPAVHYAAGSGPFSMAVGDFNGDGFPDLAVADEGSPPFFGDSTVSVLLGNGDGTFRPGDFNGDGIPDLAVVDYIDPRIGSDGNVSLLLGNGDGTFQDARYSPAAPGALSVAVGDFNGDHISDLAVLSGRGYLSVLVSNGDGTFREHDYLAGDDPFSVAVGDFNGDGTPDLAASDAGNSRVNVWLGNGDGTFQYRSTSAAGDEPFSVAVGDFNGDGTLDLAVADYDFRSPGVSVLLGNGDGTFQPAMTYDAGGYPKSVAVGDFNGDGTPDLAVSLPGSNGVSILLNDNVWTGPRPGGQPPGHRHAVATAVEPPAAPVPARPPAPGVLPADLGMAVLRSPGAVTMPASGPSHFRFGVDADPGSAAAAAAPSAAAPPAASVGAAFQGDSPSEALLDRLFAEPTSGWGGDLLGEQPWLSAL